MNVPCLRAVIVVVAGSCLVPAVASAQSPDDLINQARGSHGVSLMPSAGKGTLHRSRAPIGRPGQRLGLGANPSGGAAKPGAIGPKPKLTIGCRRTGKRFTCRVRRPGAHRTLVTCKARKKAKARRTCLKKATQRLGPSARTATLDWQGFPAQRMAAVGKLLMFYPNGYTGFCTGTVVSRTLVLAAGHCLNPIQGAAVDNIVFLPGATWGSSDDQYDFVAPYGKWAASHWWATNAWNDQGDPALDWALIEIPPADGGQAISQVTGSWNIQPNIRFGKGAQIYSVGYPTSGYWATSAGGRGRGQYACSTTWDGAWQYIGSGWELWTRCTMNRGASGGPWFVKLGSGSWVVGGINNRCDSHFPRTATEYCDPYSDSMRSSYIDNRFYDFWSSVQSLLTYR